MMAWLKRLREAPVTAALLAANILVYVAMVVAGQRAFGFSQETLIRAGANLVQPGVVEQITRWRWLTAAFIHVNAIHIFMNMMVLVQIGVLAERIFGGGLLALAYVVTGVAGNAVSTAWATAHGTQLLSAGASGALMGMMGMIAVVAWRAGMRPVASALLKNAGFLLVLGIALSASGRGFMDNGAHAGGLAAGLALGATRAAVRRPLPRAFDRACGAAAFVLAAVAFAVVLAGRGML